MSNETFIFPKEMNLQQKKRFFPHYDLITEIMNSIIFQQTLLSTKTFYARMRGGHTHETKD